MKKSTRQAQEKASLDEWYERIKAQSRAARSGRGKNDLAQIHYFRYKQLLVCADCGEQRTGYLLLTPTEIARTESVRTLAHRGLTVSQVRAELRERTVLCALCIQARRVAET